MTDRIDNIVVIHCDDDGFLSILIGPKVTAQVIMVDDRCPLDRAYLMTLRSSSDEIRTAIQLIAECIADLPADGPIEAAPGPSSWADMIQDGPIVASL